jgi:predicted  nucleic acid-binding Zn-ribbon protein
VDRFSNEFTKLYAELDTLKRTTLSEEEEVMRTLDDVRSREEDKLQEQRDLLRLYEQQITSFKRELQAEVEGYRGHIV